MKFIRPRVIRGTQESPLPLLPSGSGGVRSYPLHEARSLSFNGSISGLVEDDFCDRNWEGWLGELIMSQEIFSVEFEIQMLIRHWS